VGPWQRYKFSRLLPNQSKWCLRGPSEIERLTLGGEKQRGKGGPSSLERETYLRKKTLCLYSEANSVERRKNASKGNLEGQDFSTLEELPRKINNKEGEGK